MASGLGTTGCFRLWVNTAGSSGVAADPEERLEEGVLGREGRVSDSGANEELPWILEG